MSSNRKRSKGRNSSRLPALLTALGVAGLLGAAVWYSHERGWLNLKLNGTVFAQEGTEAPEDGLLPGEVLVPLAAVRIPAYTKLTSEHLIRPETLELNLLAFNKDDVEASGILVSINDIVGRVTAKEKLPGFAFKESNFLPAGTRPGLVGGIPAGMRGLKIEAEAIRGIAGLGPGDRFDILSALAYDKQKSAAAPRLSGVFADQAQALQQKQVAQAAVTVLVQNGIVVEPLTTRGVPIASQTFSSGLAVRTRPVQELTIAMQPEELAPLMEALALEAELTCAPRSGRPDDPLDSVTPGLDAEESKSDWLPGSGLGLTVIDRIDGNERTLVPVPEHATSKRP